MKWLLLVGLVLAVVIVVALVVGWSLPVKHHASRQATFPVPPEVTWRAITDVEQFPSWRTDVKKVERLPDRDGRPVWVEHGSGGKMTLTVERMEIPTLLVGRIADPDLRFGGTWTYRITPTTAGSALTITEDGEIYNPIFRVMARFVFGYEATMASYLNALGHHLQKSV
jgi:uncharacterized protein YndB with AHSA1/START domain